MGMDFRRLVWKQVWTKTFFDLKSGQDLNNRAAHPHQEFPLPGAKTWCRIWIPKIMVQF